MYALRQVCDADYLSYLSYLVVVIHSKLMRVLCVYNEVACKFDLSIYLSMIINYWKVKSWQIKLC